METSTQPPPPWAARYLTFAAWSQDEFRNLLCGLPPHHHTDTPVPDNVPVPTREEVVATYTRDEPRRVDADRHVRDAVLAGELKAIDPPDDLVFDKIKSCVSPAELEGLRRAVAHDRACRKAYRFAVDAAVKWARSRRVLFPEFPFLDDTSQRPKEVAAANVVVSDELKEHRRTLVRRAFEDLGVSRAQFLKAHGIGVDTVRGIVSGERSRYSEAKKVRVLKLLNIREHDWNTLP